MIKLMRYVARAVEAITSIAKSLRRLLATVSQKALLAGSSNKLERLTRNPLGTIDDLFMGGVEVRPPYPSFSSFDKTFLLMPGHRGSSIKLSSFEMPFKSSPASSSKKLDVIKEILRMTFSAISKERVDVTPNNQT